MNTSRPSHRRPLGLALAALVVAALAACSSTPLETSKTPVETRTATPVTTPTAPTLPGTKPTPDSRVVTVDVPPAATDNLAGLARVVYFDFDSSVVREDGRPVVEANAKALTADAKRRAAIEGHTDERGGREYNLALGQRRAEAVGKALELLGAKSNQIEAVSYGKERPAAQGGDETAWAKNRRAEIVYR